MTELPECLQRVLLFKVMVMPRLLGRDVTPEFFNEVTDELTFIRQRLGMNEGPSFRNSFRMYETVHKIYGTKREELERTFRQ